MAQPQFALTGWRRFAVRVVAIAILTWIVWLAPPWKYWPMWVAALAWIAFSVYWTVESKKVSEAKSSESASSRRLHLILVNAGEYLLFLPLPGLRQRFVPDTAAWIAAGLAMLAASIALAVWARRHLGRYWSGRIETKVDHELVRTGPYRKLRHPIYTALLGMCAGTALVSGQVHALVGTALVMIAYRRKVPMEEANLRRAFGDRYLDYRRATWGAIPGLF